MQRNWRNILLLGGLLMILIVGCSTSAPEPVTITFAYPESPDWRRFKPLAQEFQELNPHITVELRPSPAGSILHDPESGVDVFLWWQDESLTNEELLILPVEQFFSRPKRDLKAFYPRSIEMFTWSDTLWAVPANLDMQLMYYNKELFDFAGVPYPESDWDWDAFSQTAEAMTTKTETGYGAEGYYGYVTSPRWGDYVSIIYQNGGEITAWNEPEFIESIEWYVGLVEDGVAAPIKEQNQGDTYAFFRTQKAAMLTGFLADRNGLGFHHLVNTWPFEWGVVPLPAGTAGNASFYRGQGYYLSANCVDTDAAWEWIQFLSHRPLGKGLPARIEVAESDDFMEMVGADVAEAALFSVEYLVPRVEAEGYPPDMLEFYGHTTESVVNNGFRLDFYKSPPYLRRLSILLEEMMQGKLTVNQVVEKLEAEFGE